MTRKIDDALQPLRQLVRDLQRGILPAVSPAVMALAERVAAKAEYDRQHPMGDAEIDAWAKRLADSVAGLTD